MKAQLGQELGLCLDCRKIPGSKVIISALLCPVTVVVDKNVSGRITYTHPPGTQMSGGGSADWQHREKMSLDPDSLDEGVIHPHVPDEL